MQNADLKLQGGSHPEVQRVDRHTAQTWSENLKTVFIKCTGMITGSAIATKAVGGDSQNISAEKAFRPENIRCCPRKGDKDGRKPLVAARKKARNLSERVRLCQEQKQRNKAEQHTTVQHQRVEAAFEAESQKQKSQLQRLKQRNAKKFKELKEQNHQLFIQLEKNERKMGELTNTLRRSIRNGEMNEHARLTTHAGSNENNALLVAQHLEGAIEEAGTQLSFIKKKSEDMAIQLATTKERQRQTRQKISETLHQLDKFQEILSLSQSVTGGRACDHSAVLYGTGCGLIFCSQCVPLSIDRTTNEPTNCPECEDICWCLPVLDRRTCRAWMQEIKAASLRLSTFD